MRPPSSQTHKHAVSLFSGYRGLVLVLLALTAVTGQLAVLVTRAESVASKISATALNKPGRNEEVFVIYRNERGESVCRNATSEEKRRVLERGGAGSGRTIYPGGRRTRLDQANATAPAKTESGDELLPSAGLRIVLHATQQLQDNATARDAFIVAANRWEALVSTPITVVLDVDFGATFFGNPFSSPNILGATATSSQQAPISTVRQQLINNAPEVGELQLYNALPETSVPVELDGTTTSASSVRMTWSVARALGLRPDITDPNSIPLGQGDAGIGFNSAHPFDFNPDDGIASGTLDFDAVVVHEIGHALGFTSRSGNGVASPLSVWDLFRFRTGAASLGTIGSALRVMSEGGSQVFFNNRTNTFGSQELELSTGGSDGEGGDGEQSSHWKDDSFTAFIGIMDPRLPSGRREIITDNDLSALDTFGYRIGGPAPPPPPPPPAPANDNFAAAVGLSGQTGTSSGTNVGATGETGEPDHAGVTGTGRRSVWYNWTAGTAGQITFNTSGSDYDTVLGIYTGSSVGALTLIGSNDDVQTGIITHSIVTFTALAGTTYRIAVDGFQSDTGNFILNWSDAVPTPTPTPTPPPGSTVFEFSHPAYSMVEHDLSVGILVTRTGDTGALQVVNLRVQGDPPSLFGTGQVIFFPGDTYKIAILERGDNTANQPNETFILNLELFSPGTALGAQHTATLTVIDDDSFPANSVQFTTPLVAVSEGAGKIDLTLTRAPLSGGDLSQDAFVSYQTFTSTAMAGRDFSLASGTLHFLPGETTKTITVLITEDAFDETVETFHIHLSKPLRTSILILQNSTVSVEIQDNDPPGVTTNPSDDSSSFVTQHYMDFLNRVPEAAGLNFWTQEIEGCGADAQCREVKRVNVSAAFFLSIEFQETGFLVYRLYKTAFGNFQNAPVPAMHFQDFMSDSQEIGRGVVVGTPGWPELLEARKQALVSEFVTRGRFKTALPPELTPEQFVDKLNNNIGGLLNQTLRDQLVVQLTANNNAAGRASVMRMVAELQSLRDAEFRRAFVLMQYFGYLRRNPNEGPDTNYDGYNFWLDKLNQHHGNFVSAEMVKAFIVSIEYRQRFGQ